MVVCVGL